MTARTLRTEASARPAEDARPLSVLQIMTCRGWSSDAWAAMGLTLGLQACGHRVMMLCSGVGKGRAVAERIRAEGVEEVDCIEASGKFRPASHLRDIAKIRKLVKERKVDVVHVHRGMEHWLAAVALGGARGPALVRSRHIVRPVSRHVLNRWLYVRATDVTLPASEQIRAGYLRGRAFSRASFRTVMGGVDASAYAPRATGAEFRDAWRIPREARVVGMAGSVDLWKKGHDVFLRAAARLVREDAVWAVVMGKGRNLGALQRLAADLGVAERVVFPGFLPRLGEGLAACDVLAFPSVGSEGTSRVLFDYLAAGRPVVASRVGCVAEIVRDGKEGVLVPAGDEDALCLGLRTLLSDAGLARSMGRSARARATQEFDMGVMAHRTAEIYREVMRSGSAAI